MVPKIAGKGASFKGAGLYYLHDKNADTKNRIAFTHTLNLPTDDAELGMRLMAHTAMNQAQIKAANENTAKTGRKLQKPVYAYSLSWSPEETPAPEHMIAAARETLEVLGLAEHEAVLVAHNDEPHPHIHIIANRVHPRTGLAAKLSMDRLKLSKWAENYERTNGKIYCEERVKNNERRRRGQFVKDRNSKTKAQFLAARKLQLRQAFERSKIEQQNLSAHHAGQRQAVYDIHTAHRLALYDEKEAHIKAARERLRTTNRPKWAEMYRRHRDEKRELNKMQKGAYSRLRYFLKTHGKQTNLRIAIKEAMRAMFGRGNPHAKLARKQEAERKALGAESRAATLAAIREENRIYRAELAKVKELERGELQRITQTQRSETLSLRAEHARQSQEGARAIKQQADEQARTGDEAKQPQTLSEEFKQAARKRMRTRKKREERSRGKGRDRGHDE